MRSSGRYYLIRPVYPVGGKEQKHCLNVLPSICVFARTDANHECVRLLRTPLLQSRNKQTAKEVNRGI